MKKAPPFPSFFCAGAALSAALVTLSPNAVAQIAGSQNAAGHAAASPPKCEPQGARDSRPNDLRTALQQQRQRCEDTAEAGAPPGRHLSTQEKAQLREQLRQQR